MRKCLEFACYFGCWKAGGSGETRSAGFNPRHRKRAIFRAWPATDSNRNDGWCSLKAKGGKAIDEARFKRQSFAFGHLGHGDNEHVL